REALEQVASELKTTSGEPLVKNIYTVTGQSGEGFEVAAGPNRGEVRAELLPTEDRGIHFEDINVAWEKKVGPIAGTLSQTYSGLSSGPPGAAIEIWLQGESMDTLLAAAAELKEKLRTYDGVYQITDDFRPGKNELQFQLKPEARALGITLDDLASQVFAGFFGEEALRLQRGRDDIRVRVRYTEEERKSLGELDRVRIRTPQGAEVPLLSVADVISKQGFSSIVRVDGLRRVAVSAEVDTKSANAEEVLADLNQGYMASLSAKFPDVSWSFEGAKKDSRDAIAGLMIGFPIALFGIYIIIATIFRSYIQPIIIMVTVPFGLIGAMLGHLAMGYDVTMMSLFGMVALAGVVVNDAIVMIECINSLIAKGTPFFDAIAKAGARRFRAVFLTTATTVGGLSPLILQRSLQAQFLIPMAITIAAGVAFATLLTLLFIPCMMGVLNDMRRVLYFIRHRRWPTPEEVEPARLRLVDSDDSDASGISTEPMVVTK
ncbi:MAG: efflux RND transporter permease subunit, partial [Candidatus Hydrogenedentales bacterium]